MKKVSLSGAPRAHVGKKDARKLRREEKIPCVLYGGEEQVHFYIDEAPFKKIIFTPSVYIINLNIDGKEHLAVIQDMQYHPVTDEVLHVDFLEVFNTKPVVISIPIKLEGTAQGVLKGGRLIKKARKLKVKGLLEDLPDLIEIDIRKLDIGDSIKVSDLQREKLEFLDPALNMVVGVRSARAVVAGEEGEGEEGEGEGEGEAGEGEGDSEENKSEE